MPGETRTQADVDREVGEVAEVERAAALAGTADPSSSGDEAAADTAAQERLARKKGWVPAAEFKGDTTVFVDAKTFNERGERFASNLQREIALLRSEVGSLKGTREAFKKFSEEALARKDAELKAAISALRVQRSEAIRNGDDHIAIDLEDQIDVLKDERRAAATSAAEPERVTQNPDGTDPVLREWINDGNAWFDEAPELQAAAIKIGENLVRSGETARGRPFMDKVAEQIRINFPRYFRTGNASTSVNRTESGSTAAHGSNPGELTERDLPPEDLALMKQFIKEGYYTKKSFLESYNRNK